MKQSSLHAERSVGPMELSPVSIGTEDLSRKLMIQALDYLYDTTGEPPVPTSALIQRDAHSKHEENERDYFVNELTKTLGIDVDEALHTFEVARKDVDGSESVTLTEWMLNSLGVAHEASQTLSAPGVLRRAKLNFDHQNPLTLQEVEVPIATTDGDTTTQTVARFMWFSAE